ncbi:MAG: hypothetical protein EOM21_18650 [Gammaproteobacteria bacterium]|nr:hypothetical protein [Gammaproteobacteria bacterium]
MPASIKIAANYFKRDVFTLWNPTTNLFDTKIAGSGRQNRADRFVSLWPKSSRRTHLFLQPEQDAYTPQQLIAIRHDSSGDIYLISETTESEFWQGKADPYDRIVRAHKLSPPSGGPAQFYPVRTAGTGDNLGLVQVGPAQNGWADTELRSTNKPDGSEETAIGEYFVTYSRNFSVLEGDFIFVRSRYYRIMAEFPDSGFMSSRASQESPKFETLVFDWPATSPSVYDPVTGTFTAATNGTRLVSGLVGTRRRTGDTREHALKATLQVYIYVNHIGFTPRLGQQVTHDGTVYHVQSVVKQIEDKQWVLELEP